MKTYEVLARAFRAEGVDSSFGMMGDASLQWYAAMADAGVSMIATRQETGAVSMAEGYAHAGGGVGVASVTSGPGLVQAGLGLANAARAGVPTVLFAGDNATTAITGPQLLDQRRFVESCGAAFVAVRSPATAIDDVRRAFALARRRRTAVVLNAPTDIQAAECPDDPESALTPPSDPVENHVVPDGNALDRVLELIAGSRRPVILAGRGAVLANAHDALLALAERLGAATATTVVAKGYLDDDRFGLGVVGPLASAVADEVFTEADLVLAFGAQLDRFTVQGRGPVFPNARLVSIDVAPEGAANAAVHTHLVGDARGTAELLTVRAVELGLGSEGFRTPEGHERLYGFARPDTGVDNGLLHPARAMEVLEAHLTPASHRVVVGSGHFWSWPIMYLRVPHGARFIFGHYFGSIGLALPLGIGAAVADPASTVVVVEGDGSLMETVQELETASRYGIRVVVLVMNDQQLGAERFKGQLLGLDPALMRVPTPRFDEVARAFGGDGALVTDDRSLDEALARSKGCQGPFVVDARVAPDVVCDMYRKLHFDLPNVAPHQGLP